MPKKKILPATASPRLSWRAKEETQRGHKTPTKHRTRRAYGTPAVHGCREAPSPPGSPARHAAARPRHPTARTGGGSPSPEPGRAPGAQHRAPHLATLLVMEAHHHDVQHWTPRKGGRRRAPLLHGARRWPLGRIPPGPGSRSASRCRRPEGRTSADCASAAPGGRRRGGAALVPLALPPAALCPPAPGGPRLRGDPRGKVLGFLKI